MTLAAGTRIGPYVVQSALGAGGMGEVYRATDTRLNRDVALKILPTAFAQDAERLARFQREAQVLASLNHQNIGGIHGIEEGPAEAGLHIRALVLELIEGPTLADRIESGPIPVTEAIGIARQIADALSAAHEHGIVHRDLKPSNIKLRPDGAVKVLDFGLARTNANASNASNVSNDPHVFTQSPTLLSPAATQMGVILGTAAYMSPEQAKGRPADKRADVWAFGCVLYEMLTGARAFEGDDVSDTMAGILRGDPDWRKLPSGTPTVLVRLLKRCLQKDRAQRLHDIADARLDLQDALVPEEAAPAVVAAPPASVMRRALPVATAVIVTASLAGTAAWLVRPAPATSLVTRFQIVLPIDQAFTSMGRSIVALSPSGSHLAYVANGRLHLRALDQLEGAAIPGTDGIGDTASRNPFFSPDGQSIAFWQGGQLKRLGIEGGSAVTIAQAPQPFGATWHTDGFVYYGAGPDGIWRVPATGGTPERLIEARDGETLHGPQPMPDGDHVLFTTRPKATSAWDQGQIVVESLRTKTRRVVVPRGRDGRMVPSGHLIYADTGTIFAIRFDADRLATEGGAAAIIQDVLDGGGNTGTVQAAVSETGVLAFVRNTGATQRGSLVRVDRSGRETGALTATPVLGLAFPRVSPDGTRIAAVASGDVWIYDIAGRPPIRVTFQNTTYSPIWALDGTRLVYESGTPASLMSVPADGSGTTPTPASPPGHYHPHGLSADGSEILAIALDNGTTGADIIRLGPGPAFESQMVIGTPNREGFEGASLSPDRRWLAYTSNATGQIELWVQAYPGPGSPVRVSPAGGTEPVWSRTGRELYYLQGRGLMAVTVGTQGGFTFSPPTRLFELSQVTTGQPPSYDVLPDGSFVMVKTLDGPQAAPPIIMTLNWFEELKRRLP